MNILSLFDGISCGRIALERAGVSVNKYYASEIKDSAIKITKHNYPDTIHVGDINNLDFNEFKDIDLVIGGSPCQSFSIIQSKDRKNFDGKSGLFFKFIEAIQIIKPKYFLLENVASMKDECRDIISSYMGVEPLLINSNCFAAQDRLRYYWTNIPIDLTVAYPESTLSLEDILENDVDEKYFYNQDHEVIDMSKQVCAKININIHDMHKRVFNPKYKVHTLTAVVGGNQQKKILVNGRVRKLTPLEYERCQTLPDNYTDIVSDTHRYNVCGDAWTVDVIKCIFKGLSNG